MSWTRSSVVASLPSLIQTRLTSPVIMATRESDGRQQPLTVTSFHTADSPREPYALWSMAGVEPVSSFGEDSDLVSYNMEIGIYGRWGMPSLAKQVRQRLQRWRDLSIGILDCYWESEDWDYDASTRMERVDLDFLIWYREEE